MNEWNIQSRAHACQACGNPFADQQHYHTLLLDLKHEIERRDLCERCWENEQGEGASDRKGFISHWQGVYEAPPAAPEPIQKENAESLLRKIMESNDAKYTAASYILAVMLERKRILKVKEQFKRDDQRIFVYEQPKTADIFTIPDPALQLNQLEQVQREVAALLEHGSLTPPPPASPEPVPASETAPEPSEAPATSPTAETASSPTEMAPEPLA